MEKPKDAGLTNLLWTGGWDSTFRLLDLLHSTRRSIQPYYLVYLGRPSAMLEMRTMNRILDAVETRDDWRGRVRHPILYFADRYKYATEPDASALAQIRRTWALGSQYLCLAQFRDAEGVQDLEMGVQSSLFDAFRGYVPERDGDEPRRLSSQAPEELRVLFHSFQFPILWTSKQEMREVARRKGFLDLLELSWFCHHPVEEQACGLCNPCLHAIQEGMEHRIGPAGLERHRRAALAATAAA